MVVTGLSENGDTTALRSALTDAGFSIDPLQVIGPDDSDEPATSGNLLAGEDLLTGDPGNVVPGVSHASTGLGPTGPRPAEFFRNEALSDRLGDLEIPDSETDNFLEALSRGHSVVAYFAKAGTEDQLQQIFRGAALSSVRLFGGQNL